MPLKSEREEVRVEKEGCVWCCTTTMLAMVAASQLGIGGTWLNEILKDSGSAHFITPGFSLILTVWIRQ